MTTSVGEDIARVTVISPTRRIDLALPGTTTLGELLPSIVRFSGYEGGTAQEAIHTWVLQRTGEDPLDPTKKIAALNIRDGETLHLRQRENAMPDAAFDDVVDAVTQATASRPSWAPQQSLYFTSFAIAVLLVGMTAFMHWLPNDVAFLALAEVGFTFFLALATGVVAIVLSRAFDRYHLAATMAWCSVVLAGMGGLFLMPGESLAIRALLAAACVLLASGTMALAARVQPYALLSAAISSTIIVIVAMIAALMSPELTVDVAAVGVAVVLALTSWLPQLSYYIARIALPNLPATAEALMADDQPVQSDIVDRALTADRILGACLVSTGIVVTLLVLPVLDSRSWIAVGLGAAVSLALMLRARAFVGRSQRLAMLVSGAVVALLTVVLTLDKVRGWTALGIGAGTVVLVCAALVVYGSSMYNKILAPVWGRLGDILEWLAVIAIVPLVLGVLNVYEIVRGIAGG